MSAVGTSGESGVDPIAIWKLRRALKLEFDELESRMDEVKTRLAAAEDDWANASSEVTVDALFAEIENLQEELRIARGESGAGEGVAPIAEEGRKRAPQDSRRLFAEGFNLGLADVEAGKAYNCDAKRGWRYRGYNYGRWAAEHKDQRSVDYFYDLTVVEIENHAKLGTGLAQSDAGDDEGDEGGPAAGAAGANLSDEIPTAGEIGALTSDMGDRNAEFV
ncbi:MAG: hypothetical protein EPN75_08685 [Beijerinckiaceae bacterium]|nr:MAG: hypothetical protein EPN75_08685 [Beijerinckiaceae bacterium]